jgi:2-desacetyl-2-hydroxyethyl bacteriochlorophyllide A dehydrogenase
MIENRKIVFTEVGKVEIRKEKINEADIPKGNILVRKLYTLISAGTEMACIAGKEHYFHFPSSPGYSGACEIVAVAEDITEFKKGDIVYSKVKHTEYQLIQAKELILRIPEGIELKYVPLARMAQISSTSIRVSDIEFGDDVAVVGQGLVGNFAMQLAKIQGANVITVDPSSKRLALSGLCGADHIINPNDSDTEKEIIRITKGRKVSTLIDATGNTKVIMDNMKNIAWKGELILLGSPRDEYSGNITEVFIRSHRFLHMVTIKGAHEACIPPMPEKYSKHSAWNNTRIILEYIACGKLHVKDLLTNMVEPEDAPEIYEELRKGNEDFLGVVFDWTK